MVVISVFTLLKFVFVPRSPGILVLYVHQLIWPMLKITLTHLILAMILGVCSFIGLTVTVLTRPVILMPPL